MGVKFCAPRSYIDRPSQSTLQQEGPPQTPSSSTSVYHVPQEQPWQHFHRRNQQQNFNRPGTRTRRRSLFRTARARGAVPSAGGFVGGDRRPRQNGLENEDGRWGSGARWIFAVFGMNLLEFRGGQVGRRAGKSNGFPAAGGRILLRYVEDSVLRGRAGKRLWWPRCAGCLGVTVVKKNSSDPLNGS